MSVTISTPAAGNIPAARIKETSSLKIDVSSLETGDATAFRAALDRHLAAGGVSAKPGDNNGSLGKEIASRVTGLAGEVKKDQQYVSKLLEQASRTGDSMHLMRAMMALHDYQLRVQVISKTVSKASTSIDSLTKLQ